MELSMSDSRIPTEANHGSSDWDLPEELKLFESQLKSLQPLPDRLARERLIYLAGRASVKAAPMPSSNGQRWVWPTSFAAMTALAASLLVMLLMQPTGGPTTFERDDDVVSAEPIQRELAASRNTRSVNRNILSTAPYQLKRIDQLLASNSLDSLPASSRAKTNSSRELINQYILSQTSFHLFLFDPTGPNPPPNDSSFISPQAGAHS
jgi:hypothetical protein